MMRVLVLCFILLLLATYFASEPVMTQECDKPCSNMSCSPPYYGTCCHKKNIARDSQHTSQSSEFREFNRGFASELAVDGNTNTTFTSFTCTHTNDAGSTSAWWMIDLDSAYNISEIKLYLRSNNAERNNGLRVVVNSTECFRLKKTFSSFNTSLEDQTQHIHCSHPIPGSFVSVFVTNNILTLCEVQIFVCDPGWYGEQCNKQCSCRNSTDCDKKTGWCRNGCRTGKQGDGCQCECDDKKFGYNCLSICGKCKGNESCNKTDGTCPNGCEEHYNPPMCTDCVGDRYGENCDRKCGHCQEDMPCNKTTGECGDGCSSYFEPPMCNDCVQGRYGTNCTLLCGQCADNVTCSRDGTCPSGCLPGFMGRLCRTECGDGKFGINCRSTCGKCLDDEICNKTDGTCDNGCPEYFVPPMCADCVPGRYGTDCKSICGKCADNVTCSGDGTCPYGCLPGFTEELCQTLVNTNKGPSNIAPVAGGVAAVIVLMIIIVVVIVILKRRRRLQRKPTTTVANGGENPKDTSFINISATRPQKKARKSSTVTTATQEPEEISVEAKPEVCPTAPLGGGNEYYSVIPAPVTLPKLAQYIKDRINGVGFDNEFKLLPYGIHDDHDEGKKPENKKRNRFLELYPYDHSRVVLKPELDADWDYINANYINGYRSTKTFIAAQGPNPVTVDDFWRMIWQQRVTMIVMVTRLTELTKRKCEQYWPDDEEMREFGNIKVHHEYSTVRRDCTIRIFKVKQSEHASESREVTQLHFTSWPDHDVPSAPALVSFWKHFRRLHQEQDTGPVVVHCSAGVGRTGTFIALDWLFDEAEREEKVNVFNCVNQMRKARMNMVQTVSQYGFLHEVVLEAVQSRNTFNTSAEFDRKFGTGESFKADQEREIQRQFEKLNTMRKTFTDKQVSDAKLPENIGKNRDQNILPENKSKPYLMTPVKGRTQYINAVVLPSHVRHSAIIATQTPLPDTVVDFWRLVYDHDIFNIICLEGYESLYPSEDTVESGPFKICLDQRRSISSQTQITLSKLEQSDESRQINVYRPSCERPSDLLEFVNEMETRGVFRQDKLLVHCKNGSDLCGLFCGVLNIITRLRLDREVDIFLDIRKLQTIRPSFIHSLGQYKFCFDAVKEYERTTSIYANV